MAITGTLKILGCADSFGTPNAAGHWGNCDPNEPKNRRKRCSALIQYDDKNIVIDTGPDFREQCLQNDIKKIDAVIYTHYHGDHTNGIEDLKSFFHKQNDQRITTLALQDTLKNLSTRFKHCYEDTGNGLYKAALTPEIVKKEHYYKPYTFHDLSLILFPQDHNTCETLGIRIGDLAYSVDLKDMEQKSIDCLKGIKTWIIDAADTWTDSGINHCTIDKVRQLNKQIKAEKVILTSLKSKNDYHKLTKELQQNGLTEMTPAFDGLEVTFTL